MSECFPAIYPRACTHTHSHTHTHTHTHTHRQMFALLSLQDSPPHLNLHLVVTLTLRSLLNAAFEVVRTSQKAKMSSLCSINVFAGPHNVALTSTQPASSTVLVQTVTGSKTSGWTWTLPWLWLPLMMTHLVSGVSSMAVLSRSP